MQSKAFHGYYVQYSHLIRRILIKNRKNTIVFDACLLCENAA